MKKNKKLLIDIGHPAQVHHFKNVYRELEKKGWQCLFTAKEKEMSIYLLEKYGLHYEKIGSSKKTMAKKVLQLFPNAFLFYKIAKRFNPDLIFSRYSAHATHIAKMMGISHVGFTDTESANQLDSITVPFVDLKITGNSYKKKLGKNHFYFNGNIELAYLHPNRFTPDESILKYLGVEKNNPFVIMRFVSRSAHHDVGLSWSKQDTKIKAVKEFSKYARVFITSEEELPAELKPLKIAIPPELIHHCLAFATLLFGESATMASECACLGVPAIYSYDGSLGYTDEEQKYGLIFNYSQSLEDQEASIEKGIEILTTPNVKDIWRKRRQKFLDDKIDVTAFMIWIAENYPDCIDVLKKNPNFPDTFKQIKKI